MCLVIFPTCWAENAAKSASKGFLDQIADNTGAAMASTLETLGSFWVAVPTIPLGDTRGNASDPVAFLQGHTWWIWSTLMVFSVLYAAGQMIWSRKGQPLMELVAALIRALLASSAGLGAVVILLQVGDSYSVWILDKSIEGGFTEGLKQLMSAPGAGGLQIFIIVTGIIAMLISLVQICLLIVRSALSVLLAGTLPLAYSATNTQWGKQWSQKHASWLIAFVLYKPVAATIYAAAFKVTGSALTGKLEGVAESIVGLMSGLVLMVAALFALPAMMRLIVPAVGAASAGGAMFAGAAVGGAASGAVNMGSRMAGKGGGSGGGGGAAGAGGSGAGGGGAASGATAAKGAAAAKGAGAAAAGAATAGVGAAVMVAGAAMNKAKQAGQALQSAVHDAAGEQAPQQGSDKQSGGGSGSRPPAPSQGNGGARGSGSNGSAQPKPEPKKQEKQEKPDGSA
jgi:type IV secretion system protein TrbL